MHENNLSSIDWNSEYNNQDEAEKLAKLEKLDRDFKANRGSSIFYYPRKDGKINKNCQLQLSETKDAESDVWQTNSKKTLSKSEYFRQKTVFLSNPFHKDNRHADICEGRKFSRSTGTDFTLPKSPQRSSFAYSRTLGDSDTRARRVGQYSDGNWKRELRKSDLLWERKEDVEIQAQPNIARITIRYSKSKKFHRYIQFRVFDLSRENELREAVESRMPRPLQIESPGFCVSSNGFCTIYYAPSCSGSASAWVTDITEWVRTDPLLQRLGVQPTDVYFTEVRPDIITA